MGVHETARRIIFKKKEMICEKCGCDGRVEVHHKDNNAYNNSEDNIIVLCSSCHHMIDKRIKNILNDPLYSLKNSLARKKELELGLRSRDEKGRFIKGYG